MSKVSNFFIKMNPLVNMILKSPLHALLSHSFMLVRFTGKKSGKEFITPMAYHSFGHTMIIVLAETKGRVWWMNFRETAPMGLCIKGVWVEGYASVLRADNAEYKTWFESVFSRAAFIPKLFGIDFDRGQGLSAAQIETLASRSGIVKFTKNRADHL
ncbi:MAG: nitroreductase family deazaflavin-dependent oxidoreductase [Pseudomonadales bacterium]|nr:nitroreductase family deazaflavin-dependent oxidoreductase [Pseudomonadales bacterium]